MKQSILAKVSCNRELVSIRTISWNRKSPHQMVILKDTLKRLEQEPGRQIIVTSNGSFGVLRLMKEQDKGQILEIKFTWLQREFSGKVNGWEEQVRLRYEPFHKYIEMGEDRVNMKWSQISIPEKVICQFEFCSRKNLHQVAQKPVLRRKLGGILAEAFQWKGTKKILIYDDWMPYSFFFKEISFYGDGICGGIILNGSEDLRKATYSIHT